MLSHGPIAGDTSPHTSSRCRSSTGTHRTCCVPWGKGGNPYPPNLSPLFPRQLCPLSPQVRLALLQLKGLEDSYNGRLDFPRGRFTLSPFGFL